MATSKKTAAKKASSTRKKSKTSSTANQELDMLSQLQALMAPAIDLARAREKLSKEDLILSIDVSLSKGGGGEELDDDDVIVAIQNQVTISNALSLGSINTSPGKVEAAIISSILEPCMAKVFLLCTETKEELEQEVEETESGDAFALPAADGDIGDPRDDIYVDEDDELVDEEVEE